MMSQSIRSPLFRCGTQPLIVIATLAATASVLAQDQASVDEANPRGIEEIVVLGSRARVETLANELPVGVDAFQGVDVVRAGESDLGAALTKLAPSFNYSRQAVGDGALLRAATLRGLGPDQTLVLINGKRRHNMAWLRVLDGVIGYGTGGTDLGAIPTTALERIEVLRDGAAAQYGSDAIAGVINLQLRDRADGGEFTLQGGTGDGNGSRVGAAFNGGIPLGDEGFLNVTAEWYKEEPLDRNGGNGGLDPDYQDRLVTHSSPLIDSAFLFLNAGLPVGDDAELYGFGGLSRREGLASGAYRFRYNYWQGLESGDETWDFVVPNFINFHERNTHPVYPNGFLPYEESRIDDISGVVGWRGAVSGWDLDLSGSYGRNEYGFGVSDTINASVGAHYLDRNPGASVADIIANAGPLSGASGGIEFDQLTLNLDVRRTFDDSALSALAAGLEHRLENYRQIAGDEASWSCGLPHAEDYGGFAVGPDGAPLEGVIAACGFQGYPGYSPQNARLSDDSRNNSGAYVELEFQPADSFTVAAALRAESYNDAGSQTTGKLAGRLGIGGGFALRGAVSTGFRAPSLSQRRFNSILFVGSETGLTTVFAVNEGHEVARAFGVDSLAHETSNNVSAGLVLTLDEFDFSIDAYSTNVEDRVVRSGGLDCAGIPACDSIRVGTAAFFFNGVDTETRGADLSVRWGSPLGSGHLLLSANANVNETSIVERKTPAGAPGHLGFPDYFGGWTADLLENGQPQRQANFTADWDHDRYGGLVRLNHYGATTQHPLDTGMIRIDAATVVDVEARFQAGTVRGALGINNLADNLPTELPKTHLSNILWGIRYPTETPFGLFGRFAYLRLTVDVPR